MSQTTHPAAGTGTPPADAGWQPRQVAAVAIVAVCGVIVALTQTLLVPVLPEIQQSLGSSTSGTQWLLTVTLLVAAVAVPVFGRLGDLYGKRLMLMVAATALLVGSLVCAFSDSLGWLIVGRAVSGASAAAIPLGISLIGSVLPAKRAGTGIALVSATLGIGGALGLPLAALVAEHADYHALFWICVAGGVIALVGIRLAVVEPPRGAPRRRARGGHGRSTQDVSSGSWPARGSCRSGGQEVARSREPRGRFPGPARRAIPGGCRRAGASTGGLGTECSAT